ncbi:MAG: hypothetical protein KKD94_05540 [Nanoarchaeota archaeon]|nr:hypothetical protein [Nanoarchaeota archaeon]MBU1988912.1 hypothetical protein [Nanoarchaeota archaeon]
MTWKTVAIIFIVLFTAETFLFGWLLYLGFDVLEKEDICSYDICESGGYESYYYDDSSSTCHCYKDGEIRYSERIT